MQSQLTKRLILKQHYIFYYDFLLFERIVRLPRVQATRREETGHKMRKHGRKAHDIDQLHRRLRRGRHEEVINKFGNCGVVSHFDQLRNSEDLEDLEDAADFQETGHREAVRPTITGRWGAA